MEYFSSSFSFSKRIAIILVLFFDLVMKIAVFVTPDGWIKQKWCPYTRVWKNIDDVCIRLDTIPNITWRTGRRTNRNALRIILIAWLKLDRTYYSRHLANVLRIFFGLSVRLPGVTRVGRGLWKLLSVSVWHRYRIRRSATGFYRATLYVKPSTGVRLSVCLSVCLSHSCSLLYRNRWRLIKLFLGLIGLFT